MIELNENVSLHIEYPLGIEEEENDMRYLVKIPYSMWRPTRSMRDDKQLGHTTMKIDRKGDEAIVETEMWTTEIGRSYSFSKSTPEDEYNSFKDVTITLKNKSVFTENFASLLDEAILSDIEFVVDGERLAAHSQIVAARSPVLAALLKYNDKKKKLGKLCLSKVPVLLCFANFSDFCTRAFVSN